MAERAPSGAGLVQDVTMPERYELIRHIANGGMASVWCAEDRVLGRRVAIKLLAERFAHDQTAVRRFKREARTAARLSGHPNVVTIYDVGETTTPDPDEPPRAFIVMEFLAGGTVADALRCGAVTQTEAIWWLQEVASALDYAHGRGVLHRDIKPANLLLDRDRSVHVADFGIAQLATEDTLTADGQLLGTAAYLAPERALGRPATEASDRYSLAVMAFELLVGERPYTDQRFAVQARQHVDAPPPSASERNPRLPETLDAVLARGMAKRPEDRFPTAHALAEAVETALAQPATSATTATAVLAAARGTTAARGATAAPVAGARRARPRRPAPEPSPSAQRRPGRRTPRRAIAVAALAAAAAGVALAAGATHNSSPTTANSTAHAQRTVKHAAPKSAAAQPKSKPKPQATQHTQTQASGTPAAATTTPPTADTLEAKGHSLMEAGNYTSAIPVLRKALSAASPASLTYAYALFDLGHSLRLAGDPRAAVPILYKRLQIPNQTGVVRLELQEALRALGQQAQQQGGAVRGGQGGPGPDGPGGPGGGPGHGHDGQNASGDLVTNQD
ncbi:MAG: serine/threonine-protein kinase [Solirubrobacteraceae bacterium]